MSYGVGRRHDSDLALLWLWYRPAAAGPVRPLVWEPSRATGTALKRKRERKNTLKNKVIELECSLLCFVLITYQLIHHWSVQCCELNMFPLTPNS